jgi:hypothetical protein
MTHLGDVTEHGTEAEITLAGETFRKIDGTTRPASRSPTARWCETSPARATT